MGDVLLGMPAEEDMAFFLYRDGTGSVFAYTRSCVRETCGGG